MITDRNSTGAVSQCTKEQGWIKEHMINFGLSAAAEAGRSMSG